MYDHQAEWERETMSLVNLARQNGDVFAFQAAADTIVKLRRLVKAAGRVAVAASGPVSADSEYNREGLRNTLQEYNDLLRLVEMEKPLCLG